MAKALEDIESTFRHYPSETYLDKIVGTSQTITDLSHIGFNRNTSIEFPSVKVEQGIIRKYESTRNFLV